MADRSASWSLHELAVAVAELDVVLSARLGVSAGDYLAVKHLLVATEPVGPVELGRLLGMSSGSATALVDRLERAGHVERHPHPSDRRRRAVTVSGPTHDAVLHALTPLSSTIDDLAAELTVEHREVVERFLGAVTDAHQQHARARLDPCAISPRTSPANDC